MATSFHRLVPSETDLGPWKPAERRRRFRLFALAWVPFSLPLSSIPPLFALPSSIQLAPGPPFGP